ncbi:MAG: molybdate ABC transporter permease subunit [Anaerolineales bacterium]|nr:molybdate ABC transporter permease subunit [Anaerolineales bacterium]
MDSSLSVRNKRSSAARTEDGERRATRRPPARRHGWRLTAAATPLLVLLTLPLLALGLRMDFSTLWRNLSSPVVMQALTLSLTTGSIATFSVVVLGTPLAYLLARRSFRGRVVVDTLVDLPMVLPPAVAGVGLLLVFGRRGLLGPALDVMGIQIVFTPIAVILAQIFVSAPFFVTAAAAGFAEVDQELEHAAALDGATPWGVFRNVTAALAWPALVGGAVMTWARALGEFGATIIFAGNFPGRTQTMPLAIYLGFERDLEIAVTLAFILVVVSFLVLVVVKWLLRQRFVVQ